MLRTTHRPLNDEPPQASRAVEHKPSFRSGTYVYETDPVTTQVINKFRCGRLLGRGGFAKCFEVFDSKGSYALKVISRATLDKPKTLQKLHSEIAIHRHMKHKHIVNFIRTFKDQHYVYILLEKCDNGTLMDLLKVRPLTVAETQFVMLQCLAAMQYMHDECVIHRDLKPGNILLDSDLNVKIGDFGLAAELHYDGERKRTICGTPNYIAPEIIDRRSRGHSFEVDIWSLGVILFTLLVGKPPFQMEDVESTYKRIRACSYDCPASVPENARDLIRRVLQSSPTYRPTLLDIRTHPFFTSQPPPTTPPTSFATYGLSMPSRPKQPPLRPMSPPSSPLPLPSKPQDSDKDRHTGQREALRQLNSNRAVFGPSGSLQNAPAALKAQPPQALFFSSNVLPENHKLAARQVRSGATNPEMPPPAPAFTARRHSCDTYKTYKDSDGYDLRRPGSEFHAGSATPNDARPLQHPSRRANTAGTSAPHSSATGKRDRHSEEEEEERQHLTALHDQLHQTLCTHKTEAQNPHGFSSECASASKTQDFHYEAPGKKREEVREPLPSPAVWVTECADFSSKYGMCYRLSTGQTGAHFNDSTKMVWAPINGRVEYYARMRVEVAQRGGEAALYARDQFESFNMDDPPGALEKKITLIKYFKSYLTRMRSSAKDKVEVVHCSPYVPVVPPQLSDPHVSEDFIYVKRWLRTPEALVFRLSNKSVQVCFNDKAEIILCSEWKAVTYTDPTGNRCTLPLNAVASESEEAATRLRSTKNLLYELIKDHCL